MRISDWSSDVCSSDLRLALHRSFGHARIAPSPVDTTDDALWLLSSNTKVITACAIWLLVDRGALRLADAVAAHVPECARNAKGAITGHEVLTHQGGFPTELMPEAESNAHVLTPRRV